MYHQSIAFHYLCCIVISLIVTQTIIRDFEQYNFYPLSVYIDNLPYNIKSESLDCFYYSKLKPSDYKIVQTIDKESKKRELHIKSKKAKNGYLYVNKCIQHSITTTSDSNNDQLYVNYILDDKIVSNNKDVMQLINLRKRIITEPIIIDEHNRAITVIINTRSSTKP